jgi:hypothetical protein
MKVSPTMKLLCVKRLKNLAESWQDFFYFLISCRVGWDPDLEAHVEGNLSTEVSMIVLDTLAVVEEVRAFPSLHSEVVHQSCSSVFRIKIIKSS